MTDEHPSPPQMQKTRIVCISDTHNQTPKLPKGDVLIHAGDLTNQGSYSELKKTVEWLEKADFEAKIVIAGNHDITLDPEFYALHGSSWRWPVQQDPTACRKLLTESSCITYLENQAATVCLSAPHGPHTCFKVFGSPCTPKKWNWAFQYAAGDDSEEASRLWDAIPLDTDIVVTHTPPKGHGDQAATTEEEKMEDDDRSGCAALLQALYRVRPLLSISGHIHAGRGVDRVRWKDPSSMSSSVTTPDADGSCRLEEKVEAWTDPGVGNGKQSIVDFTAKGGRPLDNSSAALRYWSLTRQIDSSGPRTRPLEEGGQPNDAREALYHSTSEHDPEESVGVADSEALSRALLGGGAGSANCQGGAASYSSDIGLGSVPDVDGHERMRVRRETVMVNAALMGPHSHRHRHHHRNRNDGGGSSSGPPKQQLNKPIVVDVDLPVWMAAE